MCRPYSNWYTNNVLQKFIHQQLNYPYSLYVHYRTTIRLRRPTLVFLHGIGNSGAAWDTTVSQLPNDINIVTIDLLGFGKSAKPQWAKYDASEQARAVMFTLLKMGITNNIIIVGHSLGALTAVECAQRYPKRVVSLVLCSPPLYDSTRSKSILPKSDAILRKMYTTVHNNPDEFAKIATFASKYKLVNPSFNVTKENVEIYVTALEAMIINQEAFEKTLNVRIPTTIIYGTLDPFVVSANFKKLATHNANISTHSVIAGHEVRGKFIPAVIAAIEQAVLEPQRAL